MHSDEQVEGWKLVTDAVHARGGRIFLQLWHVGRISLVDLQPGGAQPVGPSAVRAKSQTYVSAESGMVDLSEPRALEADEIGGVVDQFRDGAQRAKDAGFDGVEIHGANGYLLDQFTRCGSNMRSDDFGGSVENRLRFPLMVTDAVVGVWGADRVGYRVSPLGTFNDMDDEDPAETFNALAQALGSRGLAYLHAVEAFAGSPRDVAFFERLRKSCDGVYIANGGYDAESAREALSSGRADAVAFGEPYIANPDLAERYRAGAELNEPDRDSYYGGTEKGYSDYPTLEQAGAS